MKLLLSNRLLIGLCFCPILSKFCETLVPILSSAQKCTVSVSNRIIILKKRLKKIKIKT